ncbi:hypothetical protein MKN04_15455 [Paenibacillus polymyxa]|uniref:hypothetical protein n=1 Tax=Paenibacillus polymyxa TaxID=1406 RepID=UPI000AB0C6A4|nr:hypothetical protein [Paenibacillus polymyxa]MCH6189041.1 hypothetical protein [Paenibacillus polymyxa]
MDDRQARERRKIYAGSIASPLFQGSHTPVLEYMVYRELAGFVFIATEIPLASALAKP